MSKEELLNFFDNYFDSVIRIFRCGDKYIAVGTMNSHSRAMTINHNFEILSLFSV